MNKTVVKIIPIYDSEKYSSGFKTGYGFSSIVDVNGKKFLFDTGACTEKLLNNLKKIKISLEEIDTIVISHKHWDHMCGLFGVLFRQSKCKVILTTDFSKEFQKEVKSFGAKVVLADKKLKLTDKVFSSGTIDAKIPEQALVVSTEKGLVVIVGCAHPGIVKMLTKIKNDFKKPIYSVLGGLHLKNYELNQIYSIAKKLKSLGIKQIGPCHCSGDKTKKIFKEIFLSDFVEMQLGKEISI